MEQQFKTTKSNKVSINTTKKCPFCAETILFDARKCKHCGEFLDLSIVNDRYTTTNVGFIYSLLAKCKDEFVNHLNFVKKNFLFISCAIMWACSMNFLTMVFYMKSTSYLLNFILDSLVRYFYLGVFFYKVFKTFNRNDLLESTFKKILPIYCLLSSGLDIIKNVNQMHLDITTFPCLLILILFFNAEEKNSLKPNYTYFFSLYLGFYFLTYLTAISFNEKYLLYDWAGLQLFTTGTLFEFKIIWKLLMFSLLMTYIISIIVKTDEQNIQNDPITWRTFGILFLKTISTPKIFYTKFINKHDLLTYLSYIGSATFLALSFYSVFSIFQLGQINISLTLASLIDVSPYIMGPLLVIFGIYSVIYMGLYLLIPSKKIISGKQKTIQALKIIFSVLPIVIICRGFSFSISGNIGQCLEITSAGIFILLSVYAFVIRDKNIDISN